MTTVFASNEARSAHLQRALEQLSPGLQSLGFDPPALAFRLLAALLTFRLPKLSWYRAYQIHEFMQRGRQREFSRQLKALGVKPTGIVLWGSWFAPAVSHGEPFVCYIDQSLSLKPTIDGSPNTTTGLNSAYRSQEATYRRAKAILCMSHWAAEQTCQSYPFVNGKVIAVGWGPCGVDLSSARRESRPVRRVLHVSNDWTRKGVDFVIQTARLVRAKRPEVEFTVVGDDASKMYVEDEPGIQFIRNRVTGAELERLFFDSDLFFLPHRFDRSPHVLVEAMSASLPFVASAQGAAIELATQRCGIVAPVGDIEAYSEAILSLVDDHHHAHAMGEIGRNLVLTYYNWTAIGSRILSVLRDD